MSNYIVDTTVIIEMLRGNSLARKFLERKPSMSIVTAIELIQGCKNKKQLIEVEKTCNLFSQIEVDLAISKLTVVLMKRYFLSHGLLTLDAFIAASCILEKKILVTDNIRDFRFIKELQAISHKEAFALLS